MVSFVLEFILKIMFDFLLMESIDIEEGLCAADCWQIEDDSKMTGVSTLVFMENAVAVNQDHLRP